MSRELQTRHPALMVPHVVSLGVIVYTTGGLPPLDPDGVRNELARQLPPGTGIGPIQFNLHGIYEGKQA
jgi:hypothetical protein